VESSTTCGFDLKDASFKIICFTSAWWVFPRLVEFASEDHAQNNVFHWWFVDFPTRNLKITWTDKDLKEKIYIKRRDRGKQLEKRENHLNEGENVGKDKRKAFTKKKKLLLLPLYFLLLLWLPFGFFFFIMQN